MSGHWPLYVTYENEDPDGLSRVYVTGSLDGGATWSAPSRYAYTTSVSTYDYGQNPSFYQQQIVARVALP